MTTHPLTTESVKTLIAELTPMSRIMLRRLKHKERIKHGCPQALFDELHRILLTSYGIDVPLPHLNHSWSSFTTPAEALFRVVESMRAAGVTEDVIEHLLDAEEPKTS